MECFVEEEDNVESDSNEQEETEENERNLTSLYTLGEGSCPKSFGINVARLAGLPDEVLSKAKDVSSSFEASMSNASAVVSSNAELLSLQNRVQTAMKKGDLSTVEELWKKMQSK
mmetsp:Transcript_1989/g.2968  ORF Transcript_1989/g.2968 Transcript_1989/m.2968 type:complete len:115 (-) Transcript_1989:92-436(-)